jgi:hypothetical protein
MSEAEEPSFDEAYSIIAAAWAEIKAAGGTAAEAELAVFNRLKSSGQPKLAGLIYLYGRTLMADTPKSHVIVQGGSSVGSIVLDSFVNTINASVNNVARQGATGADFSKALKQLTEAVAATTELSEEQKKEVLETLELVAQQAEQPKEKRKMGILTPVLESIPKLLGVAASLASLWHSGLGAHILNFFK